MLKKCTRDMAVFQGIGSFAYPEEGFGIVVRRK